MKAVHDNNEIYEIKTPKTDIENRIIKNRKTSKVLLFIYLIISQAQSLIK